MKKRWIFLPVLCFGLMASAHAQKADSSGKVEIDLSSFKKIETPAEFPGGAEGWRKHLEQNLRYPKKAFRQNIQGTVKVQFMVDPEGNVSDIVALTDPGGGLAEEAVRIIKTGPKWKPATQNGKKVRYKQIQSITFRLQ